MPIALLEGVAVERLAPQAPWDPTHPTWPGRASGKMIPREKHSEVKRRAYSELKWPAILSRAEKGGPPTAQQLIDLVEYCGVPPAARSYVAGRMRAWTGCGGGKVIHGDSGRPSRDVLELVREWLRVEELVKRIERRRERYARVRLSEPRNKDLHTGGVRAQISHKCVHDTLVLRSPCPACGLIRVLRDARNHDEGWTPTKAGSWKIKRPKEYALRRVAVEEGIAPNKLRRRVKAWKEKGNRLLIELLERERGDSQRPMT